MVKIAWELLTTFNCWQLLSSSGVGQWWWWGKKPWQAGSNYSLCLVTSPVEPGLSVGLALVCPQAQPVAPAMALLLGPELGCHLQKGGGNPERMEKLGGTTVKSGCRPPRDHRVAFACHPKMQIHLWEPFRTIMSSPPLPSCLLPPSQSTSQPGCPSDSPKAGPQNRKGDKDSFFH